MLDDARTLLAEEGMEEEEQLKFIEELTAELEGKELQERGATLVDILEELQAPREGIDDVGDDYGGGRPMEGDDGSSYEARAAAVRGAGGAGGAAAAGDGGGERARARDLEAKLNTSDEHEQWELLWEVRGRTSAAAAAAAALTPLSRRSHAASPAPSLPRFRCATTCSSSRKRTRRSTRSGSRRRR